MKLLNRNKSRFYYALYDKKAEIEDEYGNKTGEYDVIFKEPIEFYGNISAAKGESTTRQFGDNLDYDKTIVIDKPDIDIDEYSVLWIDSFPDESESHDYEITRIARSLNGISIAVKKVVVRE